MAPQGREHHDAHRRTDTARTPDGPRTSNGGDDAWMIWVGGLVALVRAGTGVFRYGPRLWKR